MYTRMQVAMDPPPPMCTHMKVAMEPLITHHTSHMQVAMHPLLRVMAELRKQEGPLERLEIGAKLGEGGYGVVYRGEG